MKRLVLGTVAMLFATTMMAQELPIDPKTGKVTYMEVMETGNVTAAEAKEVVRKWASKQPTFTTTTDETDKTYYKGRHKVNYPATKGSVSNTGDINFTLQFFYKDGKFRYIMTDFVHVSKYGNGGDVKNEKPDAGYGKISERAWNSIKQQTIEKSEAMIEEITSAIKEFQNDPARSDDW